MTGEEYRSEFTIAFCCLFASILNKMLNLPVMG